MDKLKMHTADVAEENIRKIGELFPSCLTERTGENGRTEAAVDFDKLRQELSKEIVEGPQERYQFTWPGKREAMRLANTPSNLTLRPDRESSVDFDDTENLYIEGDNLEVLKLLRENYLGKVKMIYIDPPYNTGNDFVYEDDFSETVGEFRDNSGMFDADGNMVLDRYSVNSENNGRFHTDWLNMMYPRLKVAKDLLSEDGVIFISIDGNEVDNLNKLCSEIFGCDNELSAISVINNPRGRQSDSFFATVHEYLICFAKNKSCCKINGQPLTEEQEKEYSLYDENGRYRLLGLRQRGVASLREDRPEMFFPIYVNPDNGEISLDKIPNWSVVIPKKSDGREGRWMWGKKKCIVDKDRLVSRLIKTRNEYDIFVKDYLTSDKTRKYNTVWDNKEYNNQNGTQEVKALLNGDYMSFPKSRALIDTICRIGTTNDCLVVDFFSGSATTAHSVMQLNCEDGGNRKFIMVQLPESIDDSNKIFKTICDIGEERIRSAGKLIKEELQRQIDSLGSQLLSMTSAKPSSTSSLFSKNEQEEMLAKAIKEQGQPLKDKMDDLSYKLHSLDTGFRVLKLDTSNMQDVYYRPEDSSEATLFEDNVKPDRSAEDLLFQVMLECNLPLSARIEKKTIAGKQVFNVNDGYLIACFDTDVNEEVITEVARQKPYYFVMRDKSLSSDNVADNFEQIFNAYSRDTIRKIL